MNIKAISEEASAIIGAPVKVEIRSGLGASYDSLRVSSGGCVTEAKLYNGQSHIYGALKSALNALKQSLENKKKKHKTS